MPYKKTKEEENKVESSVPDFEDVGGREAASGDFIKAEDLFGNAFIICGFQVFEGKAFGGKYADVRIKAEEDGEEDIWRTSSQVVIGQLEETKDKMPYWATLKRIGRMQSLASAKGLPK